MDTKNNIDINKKDLHSEEFLFPAVDESVELSVECRPDQFSASQLARAIEDCDAHLLNMNVTSKRSDDGMITVMLRAGIRNVALAISSLERYGYRVAYVHESDVVGDVALSERINDMLRRMNV